MSKKRKDEMMQERKGKERKGLTVGRGHCWTHD